MGLDSQGEPLATAGAETPGTEPVVKLENVRFSYDGGATWALDGVDLEVGPAERLCILGANGSGKSTLASVVSGLAAPDQGTVWLMGSACFLDGAPRGDAYAAARKQIGVVLQTPEDQIVTTVVEDDVAFGPENLGFAPERIGEVVREQLHRVAMEAYAKADPTRLSGGQQQRVAIAGALAMEPRLLVLDEPGARLDVRGRRGIMHVLRSMQGRQAVVHVTHFMDEALEADRVVVLSRGKVVAEGSPREVLSRSAELVELGLEPPFAVRLSAALRERGLSVHAVTDEELAEALARVLLGAERCANEAAAAMNADRAATTAPKDATTADKPTSARAATGLSAECGPAACEPAGKPSPEDGGAA